MENKTKLFPTNYKLLSKLASIDELIDIITLYIQTSEKQLRIDGVVTHIFNDYELIIENRNGIFYYWVCYDYYTVSSSNILTSDTFKNFKNVIRDVAYIIKYGKSYVEYLADINNVNPRKLNTYFSDINDVKYFFSNYMRKLTDNYECLESVHTVYGFNILGYKCKIVYKYKFSQIEIFIDSTLIYQGSIHDNPEYDDDYNQVFTVGEPMRILTKYFNEYINE